MSQRQNSEVHVISTENTLNVYGNRYVMDINNSNTHYSCIEQSTRFTHRDATNSCQVYTLKQTLQANSTAAGPRVVQYKTKRLQTDYITC
jgi:hypothetical protein